MEANLNTRDSHSSPSSSSSSFHSSSYFPVFLFFIFFFCIFLSPFSFHFVSFFSLLLLLLFSPFSCPHLLLLFHLLLIPPLFLFFLFLFFIFMLLQEDQYLINMLTSFRKHDQFILTAIFLCAKTNFLQLFFLLSNFRIKLEVLHHEQNTTCQKKCPETFYLGIQPH